jgi:hypothetical protein
MWTSKDAIVNGDLAMGQDSKIYGATTGSVLRSWQRRERMLESEPRNVSWIANHHLPTPLWHAKRFDDSGEGEAFHATGIPRCETSFPEWSGGGGRPVSHLIRRKGLIYRVILRIASFDRGVCDQISLLPLVTPTPSRRRNPCSDKH